MIEPDEGAPNPSVLSIYNLSYKFCPLCLEFPLSMAHGATQEPDLQSLSHPTPSPMKAEISALYLAEISALKPR